MEYEGNERRQLFELRPTGKEKEGILVDKRRMIIGRSEQCDIVLDYPDIGPIHAILEITKDGKKLYDMNTRSGCFINGEKAIDGSYNEGDKLKFGSHEFEFKKFVKEEVLPPVLDMLDPTLPPRGIPPLTGAVPKLPPSIPTELPTPTGKPAHVPIRKPYVVKVAYPLAEDPKADYSEYIFEDTEDLIPIFTYDEKSSVEVTIMFGEKIFSVDYLPVKDGKLRLVGRSPSSNEVEFPVLPKKDKFELVTISGGKIQVNPIPGYESLVLADVGGATRENEGPITLGEDDILRFYKNDIQLFVRQSSSPPRVKSAPIFPKDGTFSKTLTIVYLILALFLIWMQFFVEVDKEQEEEKAAKRIARILHKPKPKKVARAKTPAKKRAATPTPSKAKKTRVKKIKAPKKVAKKAPPKKAAPKKAKVKMPKKVVTRKPRPKKAAGPPKARKKAPTKT
ncbi:MAG: FHA domain-containing protein, partial [Deltaproteobacteria bacterium]